MVDDHRGPHQVHAVGAGNRVETFEPFIEVGAYGDNPVGEALGGGPRAHTGEEGL